MADYGDESVALEELALQTAMTNHANKPREGTRPYTGFCNYCNAPLPKPRRFCDEDCKDDQLYEEERRAKLRLK